MSFTAIKKSLHKLRAWWIAVLTALVVTLIVRNFIGQTFVIPTQSMEDGLKQGDVVWVNKLSYGPRLPITLLTLPFSHKELPFFPGTRSFLEYLQLPYLRLSKNLGIQRFDIVAFNYPWDNMYPVDHRTFMVKRCIGLPGERIDIRQQSFYINGQHVEMPESSKRNYLLTNGNLEEIAPFIDSLLISHEVQQINNGLILTLTDEKHKVLKNIFPARLALFSGIHKDRNSTQNNRDLWIPSKGTTFQITIGNIDLYRDVLENHEACEILKFPSGKFRFNGSEPLDTVSYQFKHDYYFMIGDNLDNSADSRNWGLLPESHVLGKVTRVLYNLQVDGTVGWSRTLKEV